jgi:hypothetical protein
VGQAFTWVKAYITDEGINLTDVLALIMVLEMGFKDLDHVATLERKLEMLKQTQQEFSSYYPVIQCYAADVSGNDPAKCTTLLRYLNNEIKDVLALSDNVPQQFQEFFAFLQWLKNQIRAQEAEKKSKPVPRTTNITLQAPPTTHTRSTAISTQRAPMDLSVNQWTLTPEECQMRILEGRSFYFVCSGQVAQACLNEYACGCQLHENQAHVVPLLFNVFTVQTAPVVFNTEAKHVITSFSKSVES